MNEYIEMFTKYLKESKGASLNTIQSYKRDLNQFVEFLHSSNIKKIQKINQTNIMAYILSMQKKRTSSLYYFSKYSLYPLFF
jgi:integrase/recombinase XerD